MSNFWRGDCIEYLRSCPDNSVDSVVTDPPYELGFMGKSWDNSGIAYNVELWRECLRVLKPGGHLLAFGGSRTYHRLAVAVEDAGFEIRDQIMWVYGSGFPKSLDVSKAIDKAAGVQREVIGQVDVGPDMRGGAFMSSKGRTVGDITEATSDDAKKWSGWGTALKPAHEPIVVARKPLIGTVANNVLQHGTGAINIDASRVQFSSDADKDQTRVPTPIQHNDARGVYMSGMGVGRTGEIFEPSTQGRWPANFIHDGSDEVLAGMPTSKSGSRSAGVRSGMGFHGAAGDGGPAIEGSEGSAARFFYCAKASKAERNAGLEGLPERAAPKMAGGEWVDPRGIAVGNKEVTRQNFHPTVKPLALMRYLVRLVTPPGGTVLDPFLGSGTTAVAAILEGFDWRGSEMTEDYWPIIEARCAESSRTHQPLFRESLLDLTHEEAS